jgi:hypothetical protein
MNTNLSALESLKDEKNLGGARQIAMVNNFQKVVDPGAVVRD